MSSRTRIRAEIWIVLGLSLGQSAVYAVVSLIGKLTAGPLRDQTATLNASESTREYLDLTYQVLGIVFALVPVALAIYLLSDNGRSAMRTLGLDRRRPGFDIGAGVGLAALIGLPGLAFYFIGRELGMTATVVPSALNEYWWTVPVLILAALQNAVLEEVVVVGYLMTRLRDLQWGLPATIALSAAVRGSYHLYQGVGPGIGNAVMGVIFGYFYHRTGRVMPLIIAHTILDIVAFVGYALLKEPLGLP
ncbi:CPBP family intramembrane metalloprotease [Nocardioidaceae bacterium SCSIO 66511]|nr:CPBP family intramembrane metalloprotease [Nocardioidaceae bacterium SCSIO 66511]